MSHPLSPSLNPSLSLSDHHSLTRRGKPGKVTVSLMAVDKSAPDEDRKALLLATESARREVYERHADT